MDILQKLSDGTVQVTESFDLVPFGTEDDRSSFDVAMTEAKSKGKKTVLTAKVLAMPGNTITRNGTYYPADELEASIPTWTDPYPAPFIKDHNEWNIDGIIGRVDEASMVDSEMWFKVSVIEETAKKNVASGLWQQVSIGTRVKSATCSICGNDWAKGTWCEHERGDHYLKDNDDPNSVAVCYWVMAGLTGRELSMVTTPSAPTAGVKDTNMEASEDEHSYSSMILSWAEEDDSVESYLDLITESAKNGSPGTNGTEATVPTGEEEGVQKTEAELIKEAEEAEAAKAAAKAAELEAAEDEGATSDAANEGDEASEDVDEAQADGQSDEGEEGAEASEEDESDEGSESEEEAAEGEADPESSAEGEDGEAGAEGDEAGSEEGEGAEEDEVDPMIARVAELEAQVLTLKASLYVESGLRDGVIVGEYDALLETHVGMTESTLDELIASVEQRRSKTNRSEELLGHELEVQGSEGQKPVIKVKDDKNAGFDESSLSVSVKTGDGEDRKINLIEDDSPVTVTPRISK